MTGEVNKPAEGQSPDPIQVNHVIFVLDKSGSMVALREPTVNNFNEQVQNLKAERDSKQVNLISLITFAGSKYISDIRESQPLSQFEEIKLDEYVPNGNTALYDAIGHAILKADLGIGKYKNFDNAALIVILSDGYENASIEFDNEKITELIKQRQDAGNFTFTFMGGGELVRNQAMKIGIPDANTITWDYSPVGMGSASAINRLSTTSFLHARNEGVSASSGFYDKPKGFVVGVDIPHVTGLDEIDIAALSGCNVVVPTVF